MVIPADGLLILSGQVTDTVLPPIIIIVVTVSEMFYAYRIY